MKAKIKPRIDLENRTKLETVIPLRTPFIINIDPSDKCNMQCKFCPTGNRELMKATLGRNHGNMDFELYKKIIDGICTFDDKVKVIRLYKDGEPLLNPHFADMLTYAKKTGCCDRVDTTTNATLLNEELSAKIIDAGLDRINISIEGVNEEQYADFSKFKVNFKNLVHQIEYFYKRKSQCEMIVKINGDILTQQQKDEFYSIFGDIADGVFIESVMDCWPLFKQDKVAINNERGIYGQPIEEVLVCPYVFYSFAFNSDGIASLCFLDWKRELPLGKAPDKTAREIWESDELKRVWSMMLRGERKSHNICGSCGQLKQGAPDDLDEFRNDLLERIT